MKDREVKSDVDLMWNILKNALWSVQYHESELLVAHKSVAAMRKLAARVGCDFSDKDALAFYDSDEDPEPQDVDDFIKHQLGKAISAVEYHEQRLTNEHAGLGAAKAMLRRAKYDISLDEIKKSLNEDNND